MKSRSLITGITGFAGSYLAEFLLNKNQEVYGLSNNTENLDNVLKIKNKIRLFKVDLLEKPKIEKIVEKIRPNYIFHLAAQSLSPLSVAQPKQTFDINFIGTYNLLEAVRQSKIDCVIQLACSSEEYGLVYPNEVPIKEENTLRPLTPYAVSKIAVDFLGYQYSKSYGLKIIRIRAFNHEGPRRGELFVTSAFARQIALIEKGLQEPVIKVGNLEAKRDFTDVRDMVRAYYLSVLKCKPGEVYNVCSGKAWEIKEVLDYLLSLSKVKGIRIKKDPKRMRPSDLPILLGDYSKFFTTTGWKPKINFKVTLRDTLNYWRERV